MNKKLKTILTYGSGSLLAAGTVVGASLSLTSCSKGVDITNDNRSSWYVSPVTSTSDNYKEYQNKNNEEITAQYINDVIASDYAILRSDFISLGYDKLRDGENEELDLSDYTDARLDLEVTESNVDSQTFSGNVVASVTAGISGIGEASIKIDIDFDNFTLITKYADNKISFDLKAMEDNWSITVNEMSITGTLFVFLKTTQEVKPGTVINAENTDYILSGEDTETAYNFISSNGSSLFNLIGDNVPIGTTSNYLQHITPAV